MSITSGEKPGGDFIVNATESVELIGESADGNYASSLLTESQGAGTSGNLTVNTRKLTTTDGAYLSTFITSSGDGGNLTVKATESVELSDRGIFEGGLYTATSAGSSGNAGELTVETGNLTVQNSATVFANSAGLGNGGDVLLEASDGVSVSDARIVSSAGNGSSGDIRLNTGNLSLSNEAFISNLITGNDNAGKIFIQAKDAVSLAGGSGIFSSVEEEAIGNAGDINIETTSLSLAEGSEINAKTLGQGNAGNITVNARKNISLDGSGSGDSILSDGSNGTIFTRIINSVNPEAIGNAGDIQLNTGNLSVTNGAFISSSSLGKGDAGNIFVEARDSVKLDSIVGDSIGGIKSDLLIGGVGKGGDIQIATGLLSVNNGAQISASTSGEGNAGNITINARDKVTVDGFNLLGIPSWINSTASSNFNGGDIRITAGELFFTNGGSVVTFSLQGGNAGNIFLDVGNTITFDGVGSRDGARSNAATFAINGNAGNIEVKTGSLFLTNGGQMNTAGSGEENGKSFANAGNIIVNARDTIKFDGRFSGLFTILNEAVGKAGDIVLTTGSLSVTNDALLASLTYGQGDAGNININARDKVTFDQRSFASTAVDSTAIGNGGDMEITANSLLLDNGGLLFTQTFGKGDAGNITINANSFEAVNGGRINTSTSSSENAGTITLNVKDKITFSGTGQGFRSGLFAATSAESTGKGGSIFIDPRLVIIEDGASVSVGSNGTGDAGDIFLQAGTLQLDSGFITAQTVSTQGGDINLQLGELLSLRNGSQITTTAGNQQFGGDGGNINIDTPVMFAAPQENSDITADAFSGNGGNIDISTQGIFGIQFREEPTPQSDITASSQFGLSGNVDINTPEVDPTSGLIELPDNIVDVSDQISKVCVPGSPEFENEFYITGRGGLPINPTQVLQDTSTISTWVRLKPQSNQSTTQSTTKPPSASLRQRRSQSTQSIIIRPSSTKLSNHNQKIAARKQIVEATGWIVDEHGNIEFVAHVNQINSQGSWQPPASCSVSK